MDLQKYIRKNIRELSPYSTARDEYKGELGIYIDANENPFENGYNRYPDPYQQQLKKKLAALKGIAPERIFLGNGSDEPIDLVFRLFCEPGKDEVLSIAPTYGMYKVAAQINDVRFMEVALDENFNLDSGKVLGAVTSHTKIIFLCSPNNPSGNLLQSKEVERIIERFDGIVVLDEAYIDFAGTEGFLPRLNQYPNLIILQTLSKAWGLAGLRLGMAFADPVIVDTMTRVKYPYNINVVTQQIVAGQLEQAALKEEERLCIVKERSLLAEDLERYSFIRKVYPSEANFLLVKTDDPRKLYFYLIEKGIIARDRSKVRGCEGCLRLSVGTPEENQKLRKALREYQTNNL